MKSTKPKFLVDMNVGKGVEDWLVEFSYDTKAVRDIDPKMNDEDVLKIAVSEKRIVLTMDKDFGELIFKSGLPHFGVLLLRLDHANSEEKVKTIERILSEHQNKLPNNFSVYQYGKIRIRK